MTRVTMIVAALVLAAGCSAGAGPAASPGPDVPAQTDVSQIAAGPASANFVLRIPGGRNVDLLVGDRSITGPSFSLTRYQDSSDHAIRGDAFSFKVNLDVTAEGARGLFGAGPFDVKVAMVGDEIQVNGSVSGKTSMFAINPRTLLGNVGRCNYQMARRGLEYVGTRGCGSGASISSVVFPASFGKWSLPELGSALAILLSSGS
jgi:hypothetical protein